MALSKLGLRDLDGVKFPLAAAKFTDDLDHLLGAATTLRAPAHLRTTNAVESTFATVRQKFGQSGSLGALSPLACWPAKAEYTD